MCKFFAPKLKQCLNCIPISFPKYFTLGKKAPCNATSLELYTPFDVKLIIYSVPLSIFS